jgi:hypothetical protein
MVKMNELIKSASFAEKVVRCGYKKLKEIKNTLLHLLYLKRRIELL